MSLVDRVRGAIETTRQNLAADRAEVQAATNPPQKVEPADYCDICGGKCTNDHEQPGDSR